MANIEDETTTIGTTLSSEKVTQLQTISTEEQSPSSSSGLNSSDSPNISPPLPQSISLSSSVIRRPSGSTGTYQQQPQFPCSCPSAVNTACETVKYFQCPVCIAKFDSVKVPVGLKCGHTMCINCVRLLVPGSCGGNVNTPPSVDDLDLSVGMPNVALLAYLEYPVDHLLSGKLKLDPECVKALLRLVEIAILTKSHVVSRAIHRKLMNLLTSVNPIGQIRMLKTSKAIGERTLVELTSSCSNLSHYHAQQQLWAAIRGKACQFMGPAMQEEALKLVLLALEDGSALSRKVLVMFVVQRLAPQFPQASKTSVGHIVQLLYRASTFDVLKRPGNSSLMTLRPEYRNYDALRREHDTQIMKIGLEAGIRFTPEQWSNLLYGDTSYKPLMQSIIDKLQAPQTFSDLLKEFLVCVQRLNERDSQSFLSIYPHFQILSTIDIQSYATTSSNPVIGNTDPVTPSWKEVEKTLESVRIVLAGLVTFEKPAARRKFKETQALVMMQRVSL